MARKKHMHYDAIQRGFEAGRSLRDLESDYGVGRGTISKWAKRDSWAKPDRKPETGNRKPRAGRTKPKQRVSRKRGGETGEKPASDRKRSAKKERRPGQHWTEKEKSEVLAVYVETASVVDTSNETGVPARTIYRWLDEDPRWRKAAARASRVCTRMLEDRSEAILFNLIKHAESGDGKDASAAMRGIDTLQKTLSFIRGGPSERTEGTTSPEEWRRGRSEKPL